MKRTGTCVQCGECCMTNRNWSTFLSALAEAGVEIKDEVTPTCQMLAGKEGDEVRLCGIYDSHHWFWKGCCQSTPPEELSWQEAMNFYEWCPSCSFEYVEE